VVFVCKDDGWGITTRSEETTAGDLDQRARALGVPAVALDGRDVAAVWEAAGAALEQTRSGQGPVFLHACCVHHEAHFLGFQLLRAVRSPLRELPGMTGPLTRSFLRPRGAALRERLEGLRAVTGALRSTARDPRHDPANDPIARTRALLQSEPARLAELEAGVAAEVEGVFAAAQAEASADRAEMPAAPQTEAPATRSEAPS
jgi:TPP-dependent pyruvate/acetoin dehydrogenase alpha subunit